MESSKGTGGFAGEIEVEAYRRLFPLPFYERHLLESTMLAAIKLEVMTPTTDAPDEGSLAIEFHMPPICSPRVRPGRPAEVAPVISKQLSDVMMRKLGGASHNLITSPKVASQLIPYLKLKGG
ncbi:hypothetical protein COCNU_scaffold002341G000010 [Cocos nucifera]|nr:hypothetical protein [Cocos nucifera]